MKPKSNIITAPDGSILIPLYAKQDDTSPSGFITLTDLVAGSAAYTTADFEVDLAAADLAADADFQTPFDSALAAADLSTDADFQTPFDAALLAADLATESNLSTALPTALAGLDTKIVTKDVAIADVNADPTALISATGLLCLGITVLTGTDGVYGDNVITVSGTNGNLVITIDGVDYTEPFASDADTTAANWVTTHAASLATLDPAITATDTGAAEITLVAAKALTISDANSTGDMAATNVTVSGFEIGDGTDADAWGTAISPAGGASTTIADFTQASPLFYPAGLTVTLTESAGTFTGGAVTVRAHYIELTAPSV